MSIMLTETQLIEDSKYTINKVSHCSKDVTNLVGLKALFRYPSGSSAIVLVTGSMKAVPIRSLVVVKGFELKPVAPKNADGFVVTTKNLLFPVGTSFLYPESITETHAVFLLEEKTVRVSLDILSPLVKHKEKIAKEVQKEVNKASKKSGIPRSFIEAMDTKSNRDDFSDVPPFLLKIFPNLNPLVMQEEIKKDVGTFFDYEGNDHHTIEEVDKANSLIRYKLLEERFTKILELETKRQFKEQIKGK